jgi:hypothetical protein
MALADVEPFVAYRSNADVARYQSWESYTLEEGRAAILTRVGMLKGAHFKENLFFKGSWGSEFVFSLPPWRTSTSRTSSMNPLPW